MNEGTPKTLRKAIFDAFMAKETPVSHELMEEIEARIKDYCSQKFQLYMAPALEDDLIKRTIDQTTKTLWLKLFGEKLQ